MNDFDRGYARSIPTAAEMSVDAGLRSFMLGVYNKLALGLVLSAVLAWMTGQGPLLRFMFVQTATGGVTYSTIGWLVAFAPLAILLFSGFVMRSINARTAGIIYWSIVALIGASLGTVVLLYTQTSIASTFLITASAFGVLSLVGYTTKKDLTGFGSFLIMGAWGLLIGSLVNVFLLKSGMMQLLISGVGVLIFAGLIAYDTQKLKMTYYAVKDDGESLGVATNYGALNLYLDFINLFRFLLIFLGNRR